MYTAINIQNKDNDEYIINGYMIWRDKESFGFEFDVCGNSATMTCFYDEWNITYLDN